MDGFATLRFIEEAATVLLIGAPGFGKTVSVNLSLRVRYRVPTTAGRIPA